MRKALLGIDTAKSMPLLLPNFVLSKMSHESELSESEFDYPGELSHAKLLESPTHSESEKENLTLGSQMEKLSTFSEPNKQTGVQGNNFSGQTVRKLTFGISKQS